MLTSVGNHFGLGLLLMLLLLLGLGAINDWFLRLLILAQWFTRYVCACAWLIYALSYLCFVFNFQLCLSMDCSCVCSQTFQLLYYFLSSQDQKLSAAANINSALIRWSKIKLSLWQQ